MTKIYAIVYRGDGPWRTWYLLEIHSSRKQARKRAAHYERFTQYREARVVACDHILFGKPPSKFSVVLETLRGQLCRIKRNPEYNIGLSFGGPCGGPYSQRWQPPPR